MEGGAPLPTPSRENAGAGAGGLGSRREELPAGPEAPRLLWRRIAPFARESELLSGDRLIGEMGPSIRPGFHAWGECLGEAWELRLDRNVLGLAPTATVVDPGSGEEGAEYGGWLLSRGTVRVAGHGEMMWRGSSATYRHTLKDDRGRRMIRLSTPFVGLGFRTETRVELSPETRGSPLAPRLLLLTWFLRLWLDAPVSPFRRAR